MGNYFGIDKLVPLGKTRSKSDKNIVILKILSYVYCGT